MSRSWHQSTGYQRSYIQLPLALLILFICIRPSGAQGCSQCRETVGQTPARTQTAYGHAIIAMTAAASTVFLGSIFVLKRFR